MRYAPAGRRQQRKSPSTSPQPQTQQNEADTDEKDGSRTSPQLDVAGKAGANHSAEGEETASHDEVGQ